MPSHVAVRVMITITIFVVNGVGAVVVVAVIPRQEQALLYCAWWAQAAAYAGIFDGDRLTCLISRAAYWRFFRELEGRDVVVVLVIVLQLGILKYIQWRRKGDIRSSRYHCGPHEAYTVF